MIDEPNMASTDLLEHIPSQVSDIENNWEKSQQQKSSKNENSSEDSNQVVPDELVTNLIGCINVDILPRKEKELIKGRKRYTSSGRWGSRECNEPLRCSIWARYSSDMQTFRSSSGQ